ncbi:uncharacterized protein LOC127248480 [Andrographis paniculata]|uniref:uncharacterized protein LOC127248480 n=1 Tax=Andrographis paniculata TaxID=175694 RepID=UPI0021E6FD26|nr:uncharacterized protein LOC127248480 [Andrographis paniculata]XP_051126794.1 uncharacterized protein LOC127248480 [Andrographis paniculata]
MQPLFGRVIAESSAPPQVTATPSEFLFQVHLDQNDLSSFRFIATDFKSNTFQAVKSRQQMEDLRDNIGIGGSWSEFVDYIVASLKSGDVKLIIEGASSAKLIAQKAKGMPRISILLGKLVDGAAGEAMANISLELYKEFKDIQSSLAEEQANKYQLKNIVAAEQEKNANLQKQLDMVLLPRKHKSQKIIDSKNSDSTSSMVSQDSPDKRATYNPSSTKVPNRVVPVHRRSKVRGAILDDTEDDP